VNLNDVTHGDFEIAITQQGWIRPDLEDAPGDLCSHGDIRLVIGGTVIASGEGGEYTISTSALALLRTLESDHSREHPVACKLILHCGMIDMLSCPAGIDWRVTHLPGGVVRVDDVVRDEKAHYSGMVVELPEEQYRRQVVGFAEDAKKLFVGAKKEPPSPYDRELYEQFWREYDELLSRFRL
jgi:hypothetical protein